MAGVEQTLGTVAARMAVLQQRLLELSVCEGEIAIGTPNAEFWRGRADACQGYVVEAAKGVVAAWFGTGDGGGAGGG